MRQGKFSHGMNMYSQGPQPSSEKYHSKQNQTAAASVTNFKAVNVCVLFTEASSAPKSVLKKKRKDKLKRKRVSFRRAYASWEALQSEGAKSDHSKLSFELELEQTGKECQSTQ